jgi:hypothetical protein
MNKNQVSEKIKKSHFKSKEVKKYYRIRIKRKEIFPTLKKLV